MPRNICLLILILKVVSGQYESSEENWQNVSEWRTDRIVGGDAAAPGEFPYQVFIEKIWNSTKIYKCGGAIYNAQFIITAAHCLFFQENGTWAHPQRIWITAGTHDLSSKDPEVKKFEQLSWAKELFPHEGFKMSTFPVNDIALIKLAKQLTLSDRVKPLRISPDGFILKGNGTVTGFGRPEPHGKWTRQLRKASIPLLEWNQCAHKFPKSNAINPSMFCTFDPKNTEKTPCNGDSGGPIACQDVRSGESCLCGVSSFGRKNCSGVSVYSRISSYQKWIQDIAGSQ